MLKRSRPMVGWGKSMGAVHTEPGIGERADVLLAVAQFQGAADAHHLAGRGQLTDAGFGEQFQKRRSGAVHNRDFAAFDADDQVVDAEAKYGSQQVSTVETVAPFEPRVVASTVVATALGAGLTRRMPSGVWMSKMMPVLAEAGRRAR